MRASREKRLGGRIIERKKKKGLMGMHYSVVITGGGGYQGTKW